MDVYGLTGGIGSGKSTVADLLEEYGVPVVSADELSRVVVAPGSEGLAAVVAQFGDQILDERGELDRRRMAGLVFGDAERRRELEAILHPRIRDRFEQVLDALEKAEHDVCVYEVPLLFERNLQGEMKAVVLVTAPLSARITRVRTRDDVTETEVRARIAAQMDEDEKRRRADYIIENTGTLDDLRREVEFVMARFLRLGTTSRRIGAAAQSDSGTIITGNTMPPSVPSQPAPSSTATVLPEPKTEVTPPSSSPTLPAPTQSPPADAAEAAAEPADDAEQPPSRRPTAVPTDADPSPDAPAAAPAGSDEDPEQGRPTVIDTGPPKNAGPDTVHPVSPRSVTEVAPAAPKAPPPPAVPPPPPTGAPSERPTTEVAVVDDEAE